MLNLKSIFSKVTLFLICTLSIFAQTYNTISVKDMEKIKNNKDVVVVDTRIGDAFNGWALDNMKSGGHIEGATDFAYNWISTDSKDKDAILNKALSDKGITSDKKVVLYDSNDKDAKIVADYLYKKGITNISLFNVKKWEEAKKPLVSYSNYKLIAPAKVIADKINNDKNIMVFEVAWGEEKVAEDYLNGHLPRAVHINTDEIEFAPLWSIMPDDKLIQFAKNNGITKDSKVILYSTDPMPSYRLAAIMQYMGVAEVTVLNGGLAAWKRENLPLETKRNPKVSVDNFGSSTPLNKDFIVGIEEAKKATTNKDRELLVNIRTWDEYIGKISGYYDLKYKGRPTGSVWGESGSDANHLEVYRNIDNTMKNGNEIVARWKELGIDPNKKLVFFCGSGWRAAEVLVFSKVIGIKNASLYSNGWYEWSSNPNNPVSIGE